MPSSFSHSALETYAQCPRKYAFQYIEKPDVVKATTVNAALGRVVHSVLERLYTHARDGKVLTEQEMLAAYHDAWRSYRDLSSLVIKDSFNGMDDFIRFGETALRDYHASFQPFQDGTLLGSEMRLSFLLPGSSYRCSVIIDRLWKRPDGVVEIWDYKTTTHLPQMNDPTFLHQMGLYQLAVKEQFPQFERIELVQYFLRLKEAVRRVLTPDELDEIAEQIRSEIGEVRHATSLSSFPVKENALCNWCDYFALCPAKRHARILEDEEDITQKPLAERVAELAEQYIQMQKKEKEAGAELERLKGEIVEAAAELNATSIKAVSGNVNISQAIKQKFLTKTEDPDAFAQLNELARELGWNDYLKLDTNAAMKDLYVKGRLSPEVVERLAPFVRVQEETRVTVTKKKSKDDEDE